MSEYEKKRMKNVKRNEAILSAVMKEVSHIYMFCTYVALIAYPIHRKWVKIRKVVHEQGKYTKINSISCGLILIFSVNSLLQ